MPKRRSLVSQKVSNLLKISTFIAKMREHILVSLKKSTKLRKFKTLKHYNSYGYIQGYQFSPSSTPLIHFHHRMMPLKKRNIDFYSIFSHCTCFGGLRADGVIDEIYPFEFEAKNLPAIEDVGGLSRDYSESSDEEDSVDERAERFIESFYEEMRRQRNESFLQLNRL